MARANRKTEAILAYLTQQEALERDPWIRDDLRISWITVLNASRGHSQPFVDASYRVLGIHPEKVWPAILARCKALLGPAGESHRTHKTPELPGLLLLKKPPKSVRSIPGRSSKTSTRK